MREKFQIKCNRTTVAILCGLFFVRILVTMFTIFDYKSADYLQFLSSWMTEFRENGGLNALRTTHSNYNFPYLFILAIFSYIDINDLYLIKCLSILFDAILALSAYKIVAKKSETSAFFVCSAVILCPTFAFNSAYWAQCDSIYAAFCALAFLFIIRGKNERSDGFFSGLFVGIALMFKLQTILFMPIYLILLFSGKIKARQVPAHICGFIVPIALTAMVSAGFGWTPQRLLEVYTGQVGIYSNYLYLNASTWYALFPSVFPLISTNSDASGIGITLAGLWILLLCLIAFVFSKRVKTAHVSAFILLVTLGVTWFLPSMHDRYFYLAELFAIVYAGFYPRRWLIPVMTVIGSAGGYWAYLVKGTLSDSLSVFSLLFFEVLAAVFYLLIKDLKNEGKERNIMINRLENEKKRRRHSQ